jgi:hypothetical protein
MILIREDLPPSAPPAAANEARDRFPWRPPGPHSSERVIGSMPDSSNARLLLQLLQSVGVSVSISMGWLGCVLDGSSDGVPHKVAGASSYYGRPRAQAYPRHQSCVFKLARLRAIQGYPGGRRDEELAASDQSTKTWPAEVVQVQLDKCTGNPGSLQPARSGGDLPGWPVAVKVQLNRAMHQTLCQASKLI